MGVVGMDQVVDTLEAPGDAHHDEELRVENYLLPHVADDPVCVSRP